MSVATEAGVRCAVLARALGEPLAGTAPVAPRWVCLEHRGSWPRTVGAHPDLAVAAFGARADAAGWRLLLVRRPGRRAGDAASPARLYLADTAPSAPQTTTFTVRGTAELADVPLPGSDEPQPGAAVPDPLLLVCTHGRRDRCCAVDGRALSLAVAGSGEPDVWECSHLGGHRFAPTALVLPTGYLYGRLDAASAIAARKAAGLGEVETALCRGRSTWSPEGQVAELAVRAATGVRDADAFTVGVGGADASEVHVTARDGRRWAVDVVASDGPSRPASCGAEATPVAALSTSRVRQLA